MTTPSPYAVLLVLLIPFFAASLAAQATWERLADHPTRGIERSFSFELDGLVYVGGGRTTTGNNTSSLYAYDPAADTWTRKASLPAVPRRNGFGFQLNGKGYVGTGFDGTSHTDDFWRYDPDENGWTQLPDFPGGAISHCLALATDSVAYVIAGGTSVPARYTRDVWMFDGATETWSRLTRIPGTGRWRAYGWIINDKLYVGGGDQFPNFPLTDFYRLDLPSGTWDSVDLASCPSDRTTGGFFFALRGKGYYLEGDDNNSTPGNRMYSYDWLTDEWTQEPSFPGTGRVLGFSAVADGRAILGTGRVYQTEAYYNDVYSFLPETTATTTVTPAELGLRLFPNPVGTTLLTVRGDFTPGKDIVYRIVDMKGAVHHSSGGTALRRSEEFLEVKVDRLVPGIYQLELIHDDKRTAVRFVKR